MQMGEVQSMTGQDDLSENNGLGKMGKHTGREAQKGHLWVSIWKGFFIFQGKNVFYYANHKLLLNLLNLHASFP